MARKKKGELKEITLTAELIEVFLNDLQNRGRTPETQNIYRKKLEQLYEMLPEDKRILPGTLESLRGILQEQGAANGTINLFFSAANNFLNYYNHRELQLHKALDQDSPIPPELTRSEYIRLLSAAKMLEKERTYLLIKMLVNTGLNVREVPLITVEAVSAGRVLVPSRGFVHISPCLCEELLEYCKRISVKIGEVFVTRNRNALSRMAMHQEIKGLAEAAQVSQEKCNPLALRRLYLKTQEDIKASLILLIEQSHDRMVENEQLRIGWKEY